MRACLARTSKVVACDLLDTLQMAAVYLYIAVGKHNMNEFLFEEDLPIVGQFGAEDITRGVCRYLRTMGFSPLTEFKLPSNRRVDVMGRNNKGFYSVVEVKSSVADFRADNKWRDYLPFADQMYFAVANGFPIEILPGECGIMIADSYNAAIVREADIIKVNAARRKTQHVRFAKTAANRLHRMNDPRY